MRKPRALVIGGLGLNCEKETKYSLELAGAEAEVIPINQLTEKDAGFEVKELGDYQILIIEGGFGHADFWGAGSLIANKLKTKIGKDLEEFIEEGKPVLGICNGFQILARAGYLPGFDGGYTPTVALLANDIGTFQNRWSTLRFHETDCLWTKGIHHIGIVNRHGEGKFYADPETMDRLFDSKLVAAYYNIGNSYFYAKGKFPFNPNGSLNDVAAICNEKGNVLGMMPHPEAFNHITNHPQYNLVREKILRRFTKDEDEGLGIQIFRNAVRHVHEEGFA